MNLQQIKNIIREQLDQLRLQKQSYNEEKTGGGYIVCNCGKGVVCQGSLNDSMGGPAIADCSCCLDPDRGKMAYQNKRR
jgi:hypothetical protein